MFAPGRWRHCWTQPGQDSKLLRFCLGRQCLGARRELWGAIRTSGEIGGNSETSAQATAPLGHCGSPSREIGRWKTPLPNPKDCGLSKVLVLASGLCLVGEGEIMTTVVRRRGDVEATLRIRSTATPTESRLLSARRGDAVVEVGHAGLVKSPTIDRRHQRRPLQTTPSILRARSAPTSCAGLPLTAVCVLGRGPVLRHSLRQRQPMRLAACLPEGL